MSDFWSKRLGTPPAAAPRREPVQATGSPWWEVPTEHAPAVHTGPQDLDQGIQHAPVPQAPHKAMSARSNGLCPNCAGSNYFQPPGHPNAAMRCFECGYPNLHQLSGMGAPGGGGEGTPTRQVSTANNYNPGVIVGRIGE